MKENLILISLSIILFILIQKVQREKMIIEADWNEDQIDCLYSIANEIGTKPKYLFQLIKLESNFKPKAFNEKTNAVGLIQWLPTTLADYNLTTTDVYYMNVEQQLDLILKYYSPYKHENLKNQLKLFAITFYPEILNHWQDTNYVIGSEVSINRTKKIAANNKGYDLNNDNKIELKEYLKFLESYE